MAKWKTLNEGDVSSKAWATYLTSKDQYKASTVTRDKFEALVQAEITAAIGGDLPKGKQLAFAYNYGKPAMAIVDDDGTRKGNGATKAPQSLSDFLSAQVA